MKTYEKILQEELSEYYWNIINIEDNTGKTTFKDWIFDAMSEVEQQTRKEMFEFASWIRDDGVIYKNSRRYLVSETTMTNTELFDYWKQNIKEQ